MLKFIVNIASTEVLVDAKQLEKLCQLLDGSEFIETRYVGKDKGFYGDSCDYTAQFRTFSVREHLRNLKVFTQDDTDKLKTLIAMREKPEQE